MKAKDLKVGSILSESSFFTVKKVNPNDVTVVDDLGRVHFVDMEQAKGDKPDSDARMRQIDPRTIQYIIVGGIKYSLK